MNGPLTRNNGLGFLKILINIHTLYLCLSNSVFYSQSANCYGLTSIDESQLLNSKLENEGHTSRVFKSTPLNIPDMKKKCFSIIRKLSVFHRIIMGTMDCGYGISGITKRYQFNIISLNLINKVCLNS